MTQVLRQLHFAGYAWVGVAIGLTGVCAPEPAVWGSVLMRRSALGTKVHGAVWSSVLCCLCCSRRVRIHSRSRRCRQSKRWVAAGDRESAGS